MRAYYLGMAIALGASGCLHSSTQAPSPAVQTPEEPKEVKKEAVAENKPKPRKKIEPKSQSGVPLASSPDGMMKPDGAAKIRQALIERGYMQGASAGSFDQKTSNALQKFQSDHELARTGAPDRETLKALGLSPDEVLRRSDDEGETNQGGA